MKLKGFCTNYGHREFLFFIVSPIGPIIDSISVEKGPQFNFSV